MFGTLRLMRRVLHSPNTTFLRFAFPGHYYSPLPDRDDLARRAGTIFNRDVDELAGIRLETQSQLTLLGELSALAGDLGFTHRASPEKHYYYDNSFFSYGDAVLLATLLRHTRPGRVVEVGSGFSTAVLYDTDRDLLGSSTRLLLIEPDTQRLEQLLGPEGTAELDILRRPVQEVPFGHFESLEAGDWLFVDSSHTLKCGSDVNWILFEVLPRLAPGVLVHFHDILWPFEYPKEWLDSGLAWNEAYALRAYLQWNDTFEIVLFGSYLEARHRDALAAALPLALERPDDRTTPSNSSLWLRKVEPKAAATTSVGAGHGS